MRLPELDIPGTKGYLNSFTGRRIDLYHPHTREICIEDIAHALSNICRFGGHTRTFYSVAQHSCLVSYLAPQDLRLEALMHDATEAYLGDVIKPLKNYIDGKTIPIYKEIEKRFEVVIAERFSIHHQLYELIKPYDKRALEIEHGYFFHNDSTTFCRVFNNEEPCWTPAIAKEMFLSTFDELGGVRLPKDNPEAQ